MSNGLTIVLTNENCRGYASAISQTYPDMEIVVVHSSENGLPKSSHEGGKPVRHLTMTDSAHNPARAWNHAIEYACGEHLLFLSDDAWLPKRDCLSSLFKDSETEDIIFGQMAVLSGRRRHRYVGPRYDDFSLFELLENPIALSSAIISKRLFVTYGPFDTTMLQGYAFEFFFKCIVQENCSLKYTGTTMSEGQELPVCYFDKRCNREEFNRVIDRYMPRLFGDDTPELMRPSELREAINLYHYLQEKRLSRWFYTKFIKNRQ